MINKLLALSRKANSEKETQKLAREFMRMVPRGFTICLDGPLGAGKTTFVRYCAEVLGASEQVSSPTYVLQHIYQGSGTTIEHWDLYRLTTLEDELLEPPEANTLRFIEWGSKFPEFSSHFDIEIQIGLTDSSEERVFQFSKR
ncbi:MAG: tRNA (adenosine(37)-N6)-threonylcarbamoyltransferase complex ATPase subunit type 1 TsaE [Bdellovibrionales bacterium]|nr:tRNA (adenosine(37)-N6)-threonylcarbamoyltransferase complex ATPase subunit type 1 TsaE [Bdellovibrionales bacterium]